MFAKILLQYIETPIWISENIQQFETGDETKWQFIVNKFYVNFKYLLDLLLAILFM